MRSESARRPTQPRTVLTWRSRPRLRPDPHLRTAPSAVLPGDRGSSSPPRQGEQWTMPDCFSVPDAGAKCSSARTVTGASSTAGRAAAALARRESLRGAGRRYQHSRRGRHCHAERQRRYRRRCRESACTHKVTHHGSAGAPCDAELAPHRVAMREANPPMSPKPATERARAASGTSKMHCHFCARPLSEFVRRQWRRPPVRRRARRRTWH